MWSRKDVEMPGSCTTFLDMVARDRSCRRKEVITGMEAKDVTDMEVKDVMETCLEQQSMSECRQIVNF